MMFLDENGEPKVFYHKCTPERKGSLMTKAEKREFLMDVFLGEYRSRNTTVIRYFKTDPLSPDFCIKGRNENDINFLIAIEPNEIAMALSENISNPMVELYREQGAIPRLAIMSAWCFESNGMQYLCGGSFSVKAEIQTLLPNQHNEPLPEILTQKQLTQKFAQAWQQLNVDIIEPYLDKDMHYKSAWVFDEFPCRFEYVNYLRGKFNTIKRTGSYVKVALAQNSETKNFALFLEQHGNTMIFLIEEKNNRIVDVKMMDYNQRKMKEDLTQEEKERLWNEWENTSWDEQREQLETPREKLLWIPDWLRDVLGEEMATKKLFESIEKERKKYTLEELADKYGVGMEDE